MTQQNLVTGLIITASLVVSFLLGQQDFEFTPGVTLALGAANVALTYWARVSNGGAAQTTTTITTTETPKDPGT